MSLLTFVLWLLMLSRKVFVVNCFRYLVHISSIANLFQYAF